MRLLLVNNEAVYFAGAERVLGCLLQGLTTAGHDVTVAFVEGARVAEVVPPGMPRMPLPEKQRFSLVQLWRQASVIRRAQVSRGFDLLHGWGARDWELVSLAGWSGRCPTAGTLHDHPRASFISPRRQWLMRTCARYGLGGVACVSEAVRRECVEAGYPSAGLRVIRNGLPPPPTARRPANLERPFTIGFLGAFSARKGLRGIFQTLDQFAGSSRGPWRLRLAGEAQDVAGQRLMEQLRLEYQSRPWWSQVEFLGWTKEVAAFLDSIDVLLMTSSEFDPFPTVLLEAGQAAVPVVAARVGGVEEIVSDEVTGLLFPANDWATAADRLLRLVRDPARARQLGVQAAVRVAREFSVDRMAAEYGAFYMALLGARLGAAPKTGARVPGARVF
jgi:glycosyltransferase involved in cell wall biosynthesis